jgi:hypothetical protein
MAIWWNWHICIGIDPNNKVYNYGCDISFCDMNDGYAVSDDRKKCVKWIYGIDS